MTDRRRGGVIVAARRSHGRHSGPHENRSHDLATHPITELLPHDHPVTDCDTCRVEQQEFDETLAELTALAAAPPPERLRADLLTAIREVRPLPPLLRTATVPSVPSVSATPRRGGRLVPVLSGLVAAVMVIALSLGVWVHSLGEQHRNEVAATSTEDRLLSAPDVKIFRSSLDGAPVSYVVSERLDQAMLIGTDVPDPGPARTYQLWRITSAGAQPAGLVAGGRVHHWFSGSLEGTSQLAVTVERSGGVSRPSQAPRSAVTL